VIPDIHATLRSAIYSNDLLHSGRQLIAFAEAAGNEKHKQRLVNAFYQQLNSWVSCVLVNALFDRDKRPYLICEENDSVKLFLALRAPKPTSAAKTLKAIKVFGESIVSDFTTPVGECISESSLKEILTFLDTEHQFSKKVFTGGKSLFIRLANSNTMYNSECLTAIYHGADITPHFFLYHMNEKNTVTPEAVLFHELGHALHAKLFGGLGQLPQPVIDLLQESCFRELSTLDMHTQNELFADSLAIGLMYQTPYDEYDPYREAVGKGQREFLRKMATTILGKM
jgi:hypothetical protein